MTHPIIEGLTEAVTMAKLMRENDTQATRIAELEAEVSRLSEVVCDGINAFSAILSFVDSEQEIVLGDDFVDNFNIVARNIRDTAWNDAIEAAAEVFKWSECDLHPKMRKHVIGLIRALRR